MECVGFEAELRIVTEISEVIGPEISEVIYWSGDSEAIGPANSGNANIFHEIGLCEISINARAGDRASTFFE